MKFESGKLGKVIQSVLTKRCRIKSLGKLIVAIAFLAAGSHAHAGDCLAVPYNVGLGDTAIKFPTSITVPPNATANTVLATVTVPVNGAGAGVLYGTCDSGNFNVDRYWQMKNGVVVANRVGTTSVAGIGYTSSVSGISGGLVFNMDTKNTTSSSLSSNYNAYFSSQVYVTVNLVATGAPIGTGPLSLNPSGDGTVNRVGSFYYGNGSGGWSLVFTVSMPANSTTITAPACTVKNTSPSVTLAPIAKGSLGGVGSTAGSGSVSLDLNCPSNSTKVYVTLTDNTVPTNRGSTLSASTSSTASGVGFQILDSTGTPIKYGPDSAVAGNTNQWFAGQSVTGAMSIPLTVKYIQTATTVNPGTVNGVATFTMSYQ